MKKRAITIYTVVSTFAKNHKIVSCIIALALVMGVYFLAHAKSTTPTRYVTSTVTRGTIVSTVSGTGQIAAETQVDLKPKVSADVTRIAVKVGDQVKKGQLLFALDARDAAKAVRNAEINLAGAKLNLQIAQEPAKDLDLIQTQNAITEASNTKTDQANQVATAYRNLLNSGLSAVASDHSRTDTPPTISGSYLGTTEGDITITVYEAGNGYFTANGLVTGTGSVSTVTPQPIGTSGLYIKFASSSPTQPVWIISLPNKSSTSYLSSYNAYQNALANAQTSNTNADHTITEQTEKLKQLQAGTDPLDITSKQLAVQQASNALLDARETLADYSIVAPFDGTIASISAQLGQPASSGTALGTIITPQKIATIPFNEVEVSKIQTGQKATLNFDAIDGLDMTGVVVEVDAVGTVTSGVVTYKVKIALDTPDDQIKPGMSVSAYIITAVHQDVLMAPSSAIKSNQSGSYVQTFTTALPEAKTGEQGSESSTLPTNTSVTTGIADDTNTEITDGISEGTIIVTKTITATTAKTTTTTTPSIFGAATGGNRGGGSGNVRIPTNR